MAAKRKQALIAEDKRYADAKIFFLSLRRLWRTT